jgi:hypothetical protein
MDWKNVQNKLKASFWGGLLFLVSKGNSVKGLLIKRNFLLGMVCCIDLQIVTYNF